MKKTLALILALIMALSCSAAAFAADDFTGAARINVTCTAPKSRAKVLYDAKMANNFFRFGTENEVKKFGEDYDDLDFGEFEENVNFDLKTAVANFKKYGYIWVEVKPDEDTVNVLSEGDRFKAGYSYVMFFIILPETSKVEYYYSSPYVSESEMLEYALLLALWRDGSLIFSVNNMMGDNINAVGYAYSFGCLEGDYWDDNPYFEIKEPSADKIRYGDGIVLHTAAGKTLPGNAEIKWSLSSEAFAADTALTGEKVQLRAANKGEESVKATLYIDGVEVASDTVKLTSKSGLFDRIAAFFKMLFGKQSTVYDNY